MRYGVAIASGRRATAGLMSASLMVLAGVLAASPAAAEADKPSDVEAVVVTASRVDRAGFEAPTPTTVLGGEDIRQRAAINVAEVLNQVPAFRPSSSPSVDPFLGGTGQYFLDLHSLGASRTLVLVNGRRYVPSSSAGTVDLNLIPSLMVSRMEVVSGGASAAWGSDAVAGVVNVMLRNNFKGLEAEAQYGVSERGDDVSYKLAAVAGGDVMDGRGRVVLGVEYSDSHGVGDQYTRDWGREERGSIANPAGQPAQLYGRGLHFANATPGGLITAGPLAGTAFGPDGLPYSFQYGVSDGNFMLGGDNAGVTLMQGAPLKVPVKRYNGMLHAEFDISENLKVVQELSSATSRWLGVGPNLRRPGNLTIKADNAYLPAATRAAMATAGATSFAFGKYGLDLPRLLPHGRNETLEYVAALEGDVAGWDWDLSYQYGENRYEVDNRNNIINANLLNAVDAVVNPANGQIVCRSALTSPTNGCVPANLFGLGNVSQAAVDYIYGDSWYRQKTKQEVVAFNLKAEPFSVWAGPVSVAAGAEYRKESVRGTSDALSQAKAFASNNLQPIQGGFNVKEAYAEAVVPLLRDQPFAKSADLNVAVRATDYSTSGTVTTWKVGLTYDINGELRLRGARSRDIRAPNLSELFTTAQTRFRILRDPFQNNARVIAPIATEGNPDTLVPEKADTWTAGVIYQPSWAPGLRASVDYYTIDINNQIASLGGQVILDRCFAGVTSLCPLIDRTGGALALVHDPQLNVNKFETAGVDIEVAYQRDTPAVLGLPQGSAEARILATYIDKLVTTDAAGKMDRAGQVVADPLAATPHWLWTGSVTYRVGPFSGTVQERYVGSGEINNAAVPGTPTSANVYKVPDRFYTNLSAQYDLVEREDGRRVQVYGAVDNLFDVALPYPLNGPENGGVFYDLVGRAYRVGVRVAY